MHTYIIIEAAYGSNVVGMPVSIQRNYGFLYSGIPVSIFQNRGVKSPGILRAQTQSFMWLFRSGEDGLPAIILYGYSPTRSGSHAREFLEGYSG